MAVLGTYVADAHTPFRNRTFMEMVFRHFNRLASCGVYALSVNCLCPLGRKFRYARTGKQESVLKKAIIKEGVKTFCLNPLFFVLLKRLFLFVRAEPPFSVCIGEIGFEPRYSHIANLLPPLGIIAEIGKNLYSHF